MSTPTSEVGSHSAGTGSYPISTTDQSPALACSVTAGATGLVHSLSFATSLSQAALLCATTSSRSMAMQLLDAGSSPGCRDSQPIDDHCWPVPPSTVAAMRFGTTIRQASMTSSLISGSSSAESLTRTQW